MRTTSPKFVDLFGINHPVFATPIVQLIASKHHHRRVESQI
jgi:hypothetical protein